MNIKFSKGEIVRFSKKEIEQGRPKNDFIVCGFYLNNKDSLAVNYQISDGGEYVVLVTEDQIVLSSVEKSNIQKIIYIFKNIALSLQAIAFYQMKTCEFIKKDIENQYRDENIELSDDSFLIFKKNQVH